MRSLIEMQAVPFKLEEIFDWVFFSSKHAVKFFFDQNPNLLSTTKYGAISKATAQELRKFGKSCDFIGNSTDTKMVGKQFAARVGAQKVLFPIAKGSLKSIQGQFTKKEQVKDLFVYETIKKNEEPVTFADVCIFTSPSNVEAFFEKNKLTPEQKIIAMGDATAATLKRFGARVHKQPVSFDDLGLLQSVYAIC
jgi:uroporphyrinogen-III synthase